MARPLRIEFAGALYHITVRGNERRDIYFEETDREMFLEILGGVCKRFNWLCHAYCEMTNHYHLLIETPEGNLSEGMRQLNGVYTQYINRSHHRVGHLFQGRFKGILVEKESYLLELVRYIVLNPVRAKMVHKVEEWPWSSYCGTLGIAKKPEFVITDWLLSVFGGDRQSACQAFRRFVISGIEKESPWKALKNQIYLGTEEFIKEVQRHIPKDQQLQEIPTKQTRPIAKELGFYAEKYTERERAMVEAYRSGAYSMREIGDFFGVGRMTVSRAIKKMEAP